MRCPRRRGLVLTLAQVASGAYLLVFIVTNFNKERNVIQSVPAIDNDAAGVKDLRKAPPKEMKNKPLINENRIEDAKAQIKKGDELNKQAKVAKLKKELDEIIKSEHEFDENLNKKLRQKLAKEKQENEKNKLKQKESLVHAESMESDIKDAKSHIEEKRRLIKKKRASKENDKLNNRMNMLFGKINKAEREKEQDKNKDNKDTQNEKEDDDINKLNAALEIINKNSGRKNKHAENPDEEIQNDIKSNDSGKVLKEALMALIKDKKAFGDTADDKHRGIDGDAYFPAKQRHGGPGENGTAVKVNKDLLTADETRRMNDGLRLNAYNLWASDQMSLHRSLPDARDPRCRRTRYADKLPQTTVIICFHNEGFSVLLRTVHSVLDRSPPELLKEVILVDDASNMRHCKKPLEDYFKQYPKVRIIRAPEREGLIRARLIGFAAATADTVTFLDSHCECTVGWLEPLLDRIARDDKTVVCPVIDVIDKDTMKYSFSPARDTFVGGFNWNLHFSWHSIPDREKQRRHHATDPVRSPTMAGGLFTIDRKWFETLGTYDPGFDIWGGENLELSFKTWMCGGTLEFVPCSHVGHIFRTHSPYSWGKKSSSVVKKNSVRLAEVWMDGYKRDYYDVIGNRLGDYGDLSDRHALRKKLGCKSFKWYVHEVYPELFVPSEAPRRGPLSSKLHDCLDASTRSSNYNKPVRLLHCHGGGGNQHWLLSRKGEVRRQDGCLDFAGHGRIVVDMCHGRGGNQQWQWQPVAGGDGGTGTLYHEGSGGCLTAVSRRLAVVTCTPGDDRQHWTWPAQPPMEDQ